MIDKRPTAPQVLPKLPWRPQTQTTAIIALIVVVAVIIGVLYLAQATTTATIGRQLADMQKQRDALQRANEDMLAQIADKSEISKLRGRAQALGFTAADPDQMQYLVVPGYFPPSMRATPTPIATVTPSYIYDETFNGWVQQQWNILVKQFEGWAGHDASSAPRQ